MAALFGFSVRWACILHLLFVLLLTIARCYASGNCKSVKAAYSAQGFSRYDVPNTMIAGEHLQICPRGHTCCTQNMENKLFTQSKIDFDKVMVEKIRALRNIFVSKTVKFDAFFTELLDNSKKDLHEMFVKTYGLLYQQNSYVFTELFQDLRSYYEGQNINLLDALDNFFSTLFSKMFELLNAQFSFDQNYLQCVTEHMDDLKPFGDVPQKLSIQVKRAFIAARTFVQGLAIGRDVVLAVSKIAPTSSCSSGNMKMMYCPYCSGLPAIHPCNNYCMNVMKGCLAYHADLNQEWNKYIDAMMQLAERLEGPFNIEAVVDPIDVKISNAIMNLQENSEAVKTKVFSGCGQPRMGRRKREAAKKDYYSWDDYHNLNQGQPARPTTAAGTSLDRLVRDIKEKIDVAKDFWKDLPHGICNSIAAPIDEEHNCWNGLTMAKYLPEVMGDGVAYQNNNPEVDVDVRRPNLIIQQQLVQLRLITNKLWNAYNGVDVDWIDTGDVMESYSGSGMGGLQDEEEDASGGQMDDGSAEGSGGYNAYYGAGPSHNDINFNPAITWQPPVVQTRRPSQSRNKNKDNYNQNNNYYVYGNDCMRPSSFLPLVVVFVFITWHSIRW